MDVFVARQAILNRHKDLYGYELLFRSDPQKNHYDGTDAFSATSQVIANTLFSAGLEGILCGKKAFINFDREMLLDGAFSILPKETLVIEILESVEPDEEVVGACIRLSESGFMLALDDFVYHPRFEPIVQRAHIIKVDMRRTARPEQKRLVAKYGKRGIRMLAEKVETLEEFEWALGIGFDFFQGYFFTKPVVVRGRQISTSKMSCLRLLQESQREEIDFEKLRALIKDDVSFSYKLLRFTNSAMFAHQTEIRTIEHALMVLGEQGIRRWVAIAALPGLAKDKPQELMVHSLMRAQFSERLGRLAEIFTAQNCFLMGLFSFLDAFLDRTIEYALQQIKLAPQVEEALLGTALSDSRMALVYSLIRRYEAGDWDEVTSLAERLGLPAAAVGEAYVESARWVAEVTGLVGV
jgi:c-di-GMP-related signal transduction protein